MTTNNRREFLKKSLVGVCGAACVPAGLKAAGPGAVPKDGRPSLPGRILGRTGIKVPLISMGSGEASSPLFVRAVHDAGVKLFFSATYYGRGNNERIVGEGLKGVPRSSFLIGTAAPPDNYDSRKGILPKDLSAAGYVKTAEESLKRFGVDYLDILMLPFADFKHYITAEPLLEGMALLKKQGKIRFAGVASHGSAEALKAAADSGAYDVAMVAYNYKVADKAGLDGTLAYMAKAGMGIVAMKSTAGAARDKDHKKPVNINAALKWVLRNENVASIVSGMSSVEELKNNLELIRDIRLTDRELKDLELAGLRSEPGLYCQQCRKCLPQCPQGLDIPTIMRSYMYAYGYRNTAQAWYTLKSAEVPENACRDCTACGVNCTAGFDVREKILDIKRLGNVPPEFIVG